MADILVDLGLLAEVVNLPKALKDAESFIKRANLKLPINARVPDNIKKQLGDLEKRVSGLGGFEFDRRGFRQLNRDLASSISFINRFNKLQNEATTTAGELGRQAGITFKRFGIFTLAARSIIGIKSAFDEATRSAIKFESQVVKISQLTNTTRGLSEGLGDTLGRLSRTFGISANDLGDAAIRLGQAGEDLNSIANLLSQIAPATLTATFGDLEKSTENIRAILGQFKLEAGSTTDILDSFNEVTKELNVDIDELFTGLKKAGASFAALDGINALTPEPRSLESLREFTALFTSIISVSRESAEVVGTGLRTILPRLQRASTQSALQDIGVDVTDDGQFVGGFEAIRRITDALKGADGQIDTTSTKIAGLVEALGGLRQFNRVIPLITNFENAQRAFNIQVGATGSVARDAAKAQETLEFQLRRLNAEFETLIRDFVLSGTFEKLASGAIDFARSIIQITDALGSLIPLLGAVAAFSGLRAFGSQFVRGFRPTPRLGFAKGGQVPSVLTPGEIVLPPSAAKSVPGGYNQLNRVNKTGATEGFNLPRGGFLVPGRGNSDSVPMNLEEGSFVLNKNVSQQILRKGLKFGRGGRVRQRFIEGGSVQRATIFSPGGGQTTPAQLEADIRIAEEAARVVRRAVGNTAQELASAANSAKKSDRELSTLINLEGGENRLFSRREDPETDTFANLERRRRRSGVSELNTALNAERIANEAKLNRALNQQANTMLKFADSTAKANTEVRASGRALSFLTSKLSEGAIRKLTIGAGVAGAAGAFIQNSARDSSTAGLGGALTGGGIAAGGAAFLGVSNPYVLALIALTGAAKGATSALEKFAEEARVTDLKNEIKKISSASNLREFSGRSGRVTDLGLRDTSFFGNETTGRGQFFNALSELVSERLSLGISGDQGVTRQGVQNIVDNSLRREERGLQSRRAELQPALSQARTLVEQQVRRQLRAGRDENTISSSITQDRNLTRLFGTFNNQIRTTQQARGTSGIIAGEIEVKKFVKEISNSIDAENKKNQILAAAANSITDFTLKLNRATQNLRDLEFVADELDRAISGGFSQANNRDEIDLGRINTSSLESSIQGLRGFVGSGNQNFTELSALARLGEDFSGTGARERLRGLDQSTSLESAIPQILGNLPSSISGRVNDILDRVLLEASDVSLSEASGDVLDKTLNELGNEFKQFGAIFRDAAQFTNKETQKLEQALNQLNDAIINNRVESINAQSAFNRQQFGIRNPNLVGTNTDIINARTSREANVFDLAGTNNIGDIVREITSLRGVDNPGREENRRIKELIAALKLSGDRTEELAAVQKKLADIQETQRNAQGFVERVATSSPTELAEIRQQFKDLALLAKGGGQNITGDRLGGALSIGREILGSFSNQQILDRFGVSKEDLENAIRGIAGRRAGAVFGTDEFGNQVIGNQFTDERNNALQDVNKQILDINKATFKIQEELLKLQREALQKTGESIEEKRDQVLIDGIRSIFDNNQTNISMANLTQALTNGITSKVENTLTVLVDIGANLANSEQFKTTIKEIATQVFTQNQIRSTTDPVF